MDQGRFREVERVYDQQMLFFTDKKEVYIYQKGRKVLAHYNNNSYEAYCILRLFKCDYN